MPATPANIALLVFEVVLVVSGLVLLWREALSPAARGRWRQPAPLRPWLVSGTDFLLFAFLIVIGGLAGQVASSVILGSLKLSTDARLILANAGFQLGLLASVGFLPLGLGAEGAGSSRARLLVDGLTTFLIALPVVSAVNLASLAFLQFCGLPTEEQELLRLFERTHSPTLLALLVVLATLIAPIAEEVLFRGTVFRYLRTRWPHWLALLVPGLVFAALHVNWRTLDGLGSFLPLITLATILALAYERTGRIGTAIVAHAFFNLHSVILLFAGVTS
jgi:membrane protease YdiL (CAAX protease family)